MRHLKGDVRFFPPERRCMTQEGIMQENGVSLLVAVAVIVIVARTVSRRYCTFPSL